MRIWLVAAFGVCALACGSTRGDDRDEARPGAARAASATSSPAPARQAPETVSSRPRIVALGDSLTAGLGIPSASAYPALLERRLKEHGMDYEVVNAGISGDTSAGGLERLDWALQGDVRVLVVALGANDGLRGLPLEQLRGNLSQIIERAQRRGIAVVLAGMEAPPNYGRDYISGFHKVYPELAAQYHVAFVPFLLQKVAGSASLNQNDGIHPTPEGARIVADNVWEVLKPIAEAQMTQRGRPAS
jgi:acyl-CoA thioesterase I